MLIQSEKGIYQFGEKIRISFNVYPSETVFDVRCSSSVFV